MTSVMSHSPPSLHDSPELKRPKGILKNPSYQATPPLSSNPSFDHSNAPATIPEASSLSTPLIPANIDDKDLTIQNTLQNAGPRRRSTSDGRRQSLPSRSNSQSATDPSSNPGEGSPQLKWDEANLYLNEQQKTSTMKITEPKTPYAKQYNPMEDEAEIRMLDAEKIDVDELDSLQSKKRAKARDDDIPGLDIGEPEENIDAMKSDGDAEDRVMKTVIVEDDGQHDGDDEESEKHRKFEEMRRRHYEMKDVKDLLGHPEDVDEDDDGDIPISDDASEPMPNGKV